MLVFSDKEEIKVSCIILNYNTKKMTTDCIESYIEGFDGRLNYEIIVVDNNSPDGSREFLEKKYSYNPTIKMVFNNENVGFGKGNNIGAQIAAGEFLVFANSDTLAGTININKLLECYERTPNIGVLGCKILNKDDSIQTLGFSYPSIWNDFKLNFLFWNFNFVKRIRYRNYMDKGLIPTDWVTGSFFICRRSDFLEVKGFDPNIFMYAEDLDLCFRIEKSGKKNHVLDTETVYHLHGKSGDKQGIELEKLIKVKSNYRYVDKKNAISKHANVIFVMGVCHSLILWITKKIVH